MYVIQEVGMKLKLKVNLLNQLNNKIKKFKIGVQNGLMKLILLNKQKLFLEYIKKMKEILVLNKQTIILILELIY